MRYNWPVKNVLVLLPANMKGNSKCTLVESTRVPEQGYQQGCFTDVINQDKVMSAMQATTLLIQHHINQGKAKDKYT